VSAKNLAIPVPSLQELIGDDLLPQKSFGYQERQMLDDVARLTQTLRLHHNETFQHWLNVARIAAFLARRLGLTQTEVKKIGIGALFHDLGKLQVDASILAKPSKLT